MSKGKGIKKLAEKLKTRIYNKQNRLQQDTPYLSDETNKRKVVWQM